MRRLLTRKGFDAFAGSLPAVTLHEHRRRKCDAETGHQHPRPRALAGPGLQGRGGQRHAVGDDVGVSRVHHGEGDDLAPLDD